METVRLAFRVGFCTATAGKALDNVVDSWSSIVTGIPEADVRSALEDFHKSLQVAPLDRAYISATSPTALTISGPPKTTSRLFLECEPFLTSRPYKLPVYAPYHASHIFSETDVNAIIDLQAKTVLKSFRPSMPCCLAFNGESYSAETALEVFEKVIREILLEPARWNIMLQEVVTSITSCQTPEYSITGFSAPNMTKSMVAALTASGQRDVSIEENQLPPPNMSKDDYRLNEDKIAIVGMAGRFPGAADHNALWDLLEKGLDVHREVPNDRFDAAAHYDASGKGKNKSHTPFGCFIEEPGLFDARFFNMSPREAAQTDPMGRLALVTAYEALEMSGFVPDRTPSTRLHRVGTFYGQTSDDWREINAAENIDTYFITGGVRAFAPGRINYFFKFSGPSFSIDTACSSSLAAIQLACTSLWAGDCDTACAGGLNVLTNPDIFAGLSKGQFLSKTGSCKTYDNDADGYCRGDGCGTVILKRYKDAIADKDNILGCILGAATNHSAEAVSITHPHAGAQETLYRQVLNNAGVDAHEISYVEMHGTGTQAGDGIEMTSVSNVFAPRDRQRSDDEPLYLGAIKANIGHGEAASGINSLVKVLMMMKKDAIPANVGIKGILNKNFPKDLAERKIFIETKNVAYKRKNRERRKIFLNNFSAAGGNTAILLEDGPMREEPKANDPRCSHLVTVSARSIKALKQNIHNIISYLANNVGTSLSSLAYTSTARRIQHNYRIAITSSDISNVSRLLQAELKDSYNPTSLLPTKVAFTFTGQGSQYAGIAKQLYKDLKIFSGAMDSLNTIAKGQDLPSILPLIDGDDISSLSPVVIQLGIACVQVALYHMWQSWGVEPTLVIGHSLGEYAALHVAGVISASDMVLLVGRRAQLLETLCTPHTHGMLAVKASVNTITKVLGSTALQVACINTPEDTVLSGTVEEVRAFEERLGLNGLKTSKLNVPFAFHSAQTEPILESFREIAASVTYRKPNIPVLSPLTGEIITGSGTVCGDYLARHARECVDFYSALKNGRAAKLFDEGTVWVELGPHPFCLSMIKSCFPDVALGVPSLRRTEQPWITLTNSLRNLYLSGVSIDFNEYHRDFADAYELLQLSSYSFDNKRYWLDYHNNWCLTKGEALKVVENTDQPENVNKCCTTSCQILVQESIHQKTGKVIFRSNLAEAKLHKAVTGHLVNDNPLCPSSLYADMAMTAANYLHTRLLPGRKNVGLNVCKMEVTKPLIAQVPPPKEGQYLQVEANANLADNFAQLKFTSISPDGKKLQDHADCTVKYEDIDIWRQEWGRLQFMVQAQLQSLNTRLQSGEAHKLLRGMAYKLFKALVSYDRRYQGMQEVILDGKQTEAASKVSFQTSEEDGHFFFSPYWIDSLAHISGFTVNASDLLDSEKSVFISHGWSSIRFSRVPSADRCYRTYVRMLPAEGNISVGDVYILEDEDIIGVVNGLKFQNIPRKALNAMLPAPLSTKSETSSKSIQRREGDGAERVFKPSQPTGRSDSYKGGKNIGSAKQKLSEGNLDKNANSCTDYAVEAIKIISAETNVDLSELVDNAAFENLGVDSLMSLTLSAKFREDMGIEISSNLFSEYPTVGEMKKYFSRHNSAILSPEADSSDECSVDTSNSPTPKSQEGCQTPLSSSLSSISNLQEDDPSVEKFQMSHAKSSVVRTVISQEMAVPVDEIPCDTDLTEIGMDSLMSLTVLSSLREKTGVDLPSTFLAANATIRDIENALGLRPKSQNVASTTSKPTRFRDPSCKTEGSVYTQQLDLSNYPPAVSLLLQGNVSSSSIKLFLLPDGSGSATSYATIPKVSSKVAIYGLNCPYMKTPDNFTCGVETVSALYLAEIKRRQPSGPYFLGGWSAGGVIAYEVAAQLVAAGERVERLLLIDSPCPVKLEPLPARIHYYFDSIGLLGTGKPGSTPDWLLPHFGASIKALSDYEPKPMPIEKAPLSFAVWATDGVCGEGVSRLSVEGGKEPKPMTWLLDDRTDFGDNGWAQLLGQENMEFAVMGGNHFTMMKGDLVSSLSCLSSQWNNPNYTFRRQKL